VGKHGQIDEQECQDFQLFFSRILELLHFFFLSPVIYLNRRQERTVHVHSASTLHLVLSHHQCPAYAAD
jgi:hypothetical protein